MTQVYKTVQEAAIAGTVGAMELAKRDGWEYGGVVIVQGDGFIVSKLVTSKNKHSVNLTDAYPPPYNTENVKMRSPEFVEFRKQVVAFFHVHLHGERNSFSGQDVAAAMSLRAPAYMGDARTGSIRVVDMTKKETFEATAGDVSIDLMNLLEDGPGLAATGTEVHSIPGAPELDKDNEAGDMGEILHRLLKAA